MPPALGIDPPGEKQGKQSADDQAKDLLKKYKGLSDKAQLGAEGERILQELSDLRGSSVSPTLRSEVLRLLVDATKLRLQHELRTYHQYFGDYSKTDPKGSLPDWMPRVVVKEYEYQLGPQTLREADKRKSGDDELPLGYSQQEHPAEKPKVQRQPGQWEYKVATAAEVQKLGKDDLTAGLNRLGEDRWELVGLDHASRYIFKRPK